MKTSVSFRNMVIYVICMLYILLFVYAAISKLLDFQNFKVQLGQSPLLAAFAGFFSIAVPLVELLIAIGLLFSKSQLVSLYISFCLMVMFTSYIYIILNFSSSIPCSCGGVLEKMDWRQHLIFNSLFVVLAAVAILLYNKKTTSYEN